MNAAAASTQDFINKAETMCKKDNSDQGRPCTAIEAVSITSPTIDAALRETVEKILRVKQIRNAIVAEYVLSQEGRLVTYSAESMEGTRNVLIHALNTGAEVPGLLGIDAAGNSFMATFGIGGLASERATQDVLSFKDEFLERHAALLRDPSQEIEKDPTHDLGDMGDLQDDPQPATALPD
jgi:hypothetical protein